VYWYNKAARVCPRLALPEFQHVENNAMAFADADSTSPHRTRNEDGRRLGSESHDANDLATLVAALLLTRCDRDLPRSGEVITVVVEGEPQVAMGDQFGRFQLPVHRKQNDRLRVTVRV
jgi:hypothetical protein